MRILAVLTLFGLSLLACKPASINSTSSTIKNDLRSKNEAELIPNPINNMIQNRTEVYIAGKTNFIIFGEKLSKQGGKTLWISPTHSNWYEG